jgi:Protein of unknown function (DUF1573)
LACPLFFRNVGPDALTIKKVDVTCGCTTTMLDKYTYQAGEQGMLSVQFDTSGLGGVQEKALHVSYDQGPIIILRVRISLAEAPAIVPVFLYWQQNGARDERTAQFHFPAGNTEFPTAIEASSSAVVSRLSQRNDGSWVIAVTPASTAELTNVMLTITTNHGRRLRLFASVRPVNAPATTSTP